MNAELKTEVELTCVVLHVGEYITAWETNQLRLLRISNIQKNVNVRRLQVLRFIVGEDRKDFVTIKEGTDRVTDEHNDETIVTRVAFSPNQNHASFNSSVGVSNMYGYVVMLDNDSNPTYDKSKIYKVKVALDQFLDELTPIFKAVSTPIPDTMTSDADAVFFNSVKLFEEKMLQKQRKDGLGSSRVPSYQNDNVPRIPCPFFEPRERHTEYKALFYHAKCMWTSIGDAEVRVLIRSQDNQGEVKIGSWLTVRIDLGKLAKNRPHRVAKILSVEEIPYPMKTVRGNIVVTGEIRLDMKRYEFTGVRYYKEGVLGLVEVPHYIYDRKPKIADFYMIKKPFTIDEIPVYWRAEEHIAEPYEGNFENNLNDNSEFDDRQDKQMSPSPPPIEKSEQPMYRRNGPEFSSGRPNQFRNQEYQGNMPGPASTGPSRFNEAQSPWIHDAQDNGFSGTIAPHYASGNTTRTQSRATLSDYDTAPRANSSVSTWLAPPLPTGVIEPNGFGRDKAIAANKEGPLMIVYLCTYRRPARMMWQELDGRSVTLGDIFTCEFKKINPIDHVDLEVTRVVDVLPEQNTCRIDDSNTKCELGTSVDMSYSDPKLNACRKFGINPIMNCEFGFLMIADYVVDPSGNRIKAKPLIDQYDKVKSAKNMVGFCHYVLHQCPMTLFDENAPPEDRDMAYIWELFELTSTADLFVQKQDVLDHNNLGSRRDQLKEEDDIARTKRLNKERALAESRIRNSQAGSEYTPSYAPSQERMSSSQSYHTDNSRPPSSVYGSAFSGRSDLNRTPVPMSSQQSCHSSNFGQHASGPAPYMNNAPIPPTLLERSMNRHVETIRTLTAFINHIEQQFSDVNINLNHLKGEREDIQMIVDEYYRSGSGPSTASYRC